LNKEYGAWRTSQHLKAIAGIFACNGYPQKKAAQMSCFFFV